MSQFSHRGVGVIVTNAARSRYFVQQKDAHYAHYPRCYSFFGGALGPGETARAAAGRELVEELGVTTAAVILAGDIRIVFEGAVAATTTFHLTLLEAVIEEEPLEALARVEVLEGERGVVVDRADLSSLPYVWSLAEVVDAYLAQL